MLCLANGEAKYFRQRGWTLSANHSNRRICTQKKGRLRCHKRPKSREENAQGGQAIAGGLPHITHISRSRSAAQLYGGKRRAPKGFMEQYEGLWRSWNHAASPSTRCPSSAGHPTVAPVQPKLCRRRKGAVRLSRSSRPPHPALHIRFVAIRPS
jgi:hypothetical protein